MDPEFSGSDLDFRPIWIRGQEKNVRSGSGKTPGSNKLLFRSTKWHSEANGQLVVTSLPVRMRYVEAYATHTRQKMVSWVRLLANGTVAAPIRTDKLTAQRWFLRQILRKQNNNM